MKQNIWEGGRLTFVGTMNYSWIPSLWWWTTPEPWFWTSWILSIQ